MEPVYAYTEELPSGDDCNCDEDRVALPTPDQVRSKSANENGGPSQSFRPAPVRFPELGLIVKWGEDVTIAEGQCLWFIRKRLGLEVPAPEIYGWRRDGNQTFLYLQFVEGDQLANRWDELAKHGKDAVCDQLQSIVQNVRRIRQAGGELEESLWQRLLNGIHSFLGYQASRSPIKLSQIDGTGLRDVMFHDVGQYPAGPFNNTKDFHDWFARLASRISSNPREEIEELAGLSDDVDVVFTHDDLDSSNILISKDGDGPIKIVAILDWLQSGWYPEPWELLKARSVAAPGSDWAEQYLPKVFPQVDHGYHLAWEYVSMACM